MVDVCFYTDAEEIPKQINPLGLKRWLAVYKILLKSGAVGNADRMNQRRVRVLPRSESRRGAYAAKPRHTCQFKKKRIMVS